jgi:hypothetical protein
LRIFLWLPVALGLISAQASPPVLSTQSQPQHSEKPSAKNSKAKCLEVRFAGEVTRDQQYVHAVPGGLEFHLLPLREGWSLRMGRAGDKTEDYLGIATPPYHGVNADVIEAWHFRNADNTGPNEGQANAPAKIRDFSFVLNHFQYQKFSHALDVWSGADPQATEKQRAEATDFLLNAPRQNGTLTIEDMKLGGLEKGTRPWFESMKFNVELCIPPSSAPSSRKDNAAKIPAPKNAP